MRLDTIYQLFLCDRDSYCSGRTLEYYKDNIPRFIHFVSEASQVAPDQVDSDVITRELVVQYLGWLRSKNRKNTTINTYFRAVKVFLNYAIDEGYCSPDCLRKVKFLKSDASSVVPLSEWEVDDLDGLFNPKLESGIRNLSIVHLMLDAGLRSSEVVRLRFKDINFTNNYINVLGKGDKYRTVLLCPKLKRFLFHYLLKFRNFSQEENYPVFTQIGTSKPINSNVIKQLFSRCKKQAGIDRLHPHLLRHTFATSYILGGGNMEFLRLMLGHSDYETTKIYLHLAQEAKMLHYDIYKLDPIYFKSLY